MPRAAVLLLVCCCAAFVAVSTAYPTRWDPCTPPTSGQGNHFAANGGAKPLTDKRIKVVLTYKNKAVAYYCPGGNYGVKITWPTRRHAFITTKLGRFTPNDGCAGKRYRFTEDQVTKSWVAKLRMPCSAKGNNVIKVVTSESSSSPYRQNRVTIKRGTAAQCRGFKC